MYDEDSKGESFFKISILLFLIIFINFTPLSIAYAEQQKQKSLLEQLDEEEKKERISNIHQGPTKPAAETLQNARKNVQVNTNSCPDGATRRKIEDVREYIKRQEDFQTKISASLEQFTSKLIDRSQAISELNSLIGQNNETVIWGQGKVTNGVCGPVNQTIIIGKAVGVSKLLIEEYRKALSLK